MFHHAINIDDVVGRAAANIEHDRAHLLLLRRQQSQRGSQAGENRLIHFQLHPLDQADGVLDAVEVAVNHVHVHFQPLTQHAHGIGNAVLAVHNEMLPDRVERSVFGGQIDSPGVLDDVLLVVLGDFPIQRQNLMHPAVVQALHMRTGDAEINTADFHVGHLLRFDDRGAHVIRRLLRIHDLAFAHAARARLAESHDVQRALVADLADDGANLRGADFQPDDDGVGVKHFSSSCEVFWALWPC